MKSDQIRVVVCVVPSPVVSLPLSLPRCISPAPVFVVFAPAVVVVVASAAISAAAVVPPSASPPRVEAVQVA